MHGNANEKKLDVTSTPSTDHLRLKLKRFGVEPEHRRSFSATAFSFFETEKGYSKVTLTPPEYQRRSQENSIANSTNNDESQNQPDSLKHTIIAIKIDDCTNNRDFVNMDKLSDKKVQEDLTCPLYSPFSGNEDLSKLPENEESSTALKKFMASVVLLILSWAASSYSVAIADERTPNPKIYKPLPDVFMDNFNRISWAARASEVTILMFVGMFVIMVIFHKCRRLIVQRCFIILSLLYLFRGLTVIVTSMPMTGPHLICSSRKPVTIKDRIKRAANVMLSQGMEINGNQMCGDYIFSGHTCMLVVLAHFLTEYAPKRTLAFPFLIWSACGLGAVCILLGHFHYTVDVVLAIVISSRLFTYYHVLCYCPEMFSARSIKRFKYVLPLFYAFENQITCRQTIRYSNTAELPLSPFPSIKNINLNQRMVFSATRPGHIERFLLRTLKSILQLLNKQT
ncbi:hypothetical protein ACOME3_008946 [Neoechinorhynchus agilis]